MPAPLPLPLRQLIVQRARQGQSAVAIAHDLQLSLRTVRHLLQRSRSRADPLDLETAYRPGPGRPAPQQHLYELALAFRLQHPTWGAGYIRLRLAQAHPDQTPPSERALQRWFRQQRQPSAPPGRRPDSATERGRQPHERWQMDAADQLRLGSGQGVCWLRLVDECSGAFLDTTVFPPAVLGLRPRERRAGAVASGLRTLGAARRSAGGQRRAVGLVE